MTTPAALLAAIARALPAALSPSLTATSQGSDVYEAFLFTEIVAAARRQGASVSFGSIGSSSPSTFVFRTSPGHIYSKEQDYGFGVLEFPRCRPLEVHMGVRVAGDSRVLHECDVVVLHRSEAESCRQQVRPPRRHTVVMAIEAKFYGPRLPLGLGREFVGLSSELGRDETGFVSNSYSPMVSRLLEKKGSNWYLETTDADSRLFQSWCEEVFRGFKARS